MTPSGAQPPQSYGRGQRRVLDRQWLEYLKHAGVTGDGSNVARWDAFLRGAAEFNDGKYFESHETWEEAWREAPYPECLFLLGLTKSAVGLAHLQRGNARGAQRLLADGLRCLAPFPATYAGMDLEPFRTAIRACAAAGAAPPRIRLLGRP